MIHFLVVFALCAIPFATWLTGWGKGHPQLGFWLGLLSIFGLLIVIFWVHTTFRASLQWHNMFTGVGGHKVIRMNRAGKHQPHPVYVPASRRTK